jgi:hypothetical protein
MVDTLRFAGGRRERARLADELRRLNTVLKRNSPTDLREGRAVEDSGCSG